MRFVYADPPYIGQAKKHYGSRPEYAGEVCHRKLIAHLRDTSEAWALSCSSPSLEEVLHICREILGVNKVRVGIWVKPFCAFKKNVNPAYAYEPVIFSKTIRKRTAKQPTERDWVSACITLRKGLSGAKPLDFCFWLFDFANLNGDDEFVDMFPGTGIVGEAWSMWCRKAEQP